MIIPLFICAIVAGIGYHYSSPKNEEYSYGNMPLPGPKGIPYFGNLFQIGLHQYLTFGKWARMYGPIFEIRLGVKRWVVISDAQIAQELMVKRGANYSARDQSYIMNEIVHPGGRGMLAASGDYWRKIRRLAHNGLAQKPVESYTPFIEKESLELVRTLYGVTMDPENPFRRFGLNIVFTVTFGKRFDDLNDPVLLQLQKVITTTIKHLGKPFFFIPHALGMIIMVS
ncbi:cytochrome P450 [Jimgerdemannia flammicorona]|uniref:Cytochrome P450 n=2 Tax=Jimgerdemannia flammicorona TaxID=994334 RepID=A0A433QI41_9FUNG|nr:cytochrome P450 [Jimgerdemannia flammicorona]RUS29508.1 cytochrome P450 [Jimgerdemannia flammicorona]